MNLQGFYQTMIVKAAEGIGFLEETGNILFPFFMEYILHQRLRQKEAFRTCVELSDT